MNLGADQHRDGSYPINHEDLDRAKKIIQGEHPINSYDELLERTRKAMAEVKGRRDIILPRNPAMNIPMPPNMGVENYQEMNLVAGHRVGWEYKQAYIHKLAELFAEGYLTEAEYDKRVEWVNAAQTSEQVDVVFADLQRSMLQMKMNEYLLPAEEKTRRWNSQATMLVIFYSFLITLFAFSGIWVGIGVLTAELAILLPIQLRKK